MLNSNPAFKGNLHLRFAPATVHVGSVMPSREKNALLKLFRCVIRIPNEDTLFISSNGARTQGVIRISRNTGSVNKSLVVTYNQDFALLYQKASKFLSRNYPAIFRK